MTEQETYKYCWKWPPFTSWQSSVHRIKFRNTFRSCRGEILLISSVIRVCNSARVTRLVSNTLFFRYPHKKKSSRVKSGLHGGHKDREMSRSPKNSQKSAVDSPTIWVLAPSCWKIVSRSSISSNAMNWVANSLYHSSVTVVVKKIGLTMRWRDTMHHTLIFCGCKPVLRNLCC